MASNIFLIVRANILKKTKLIPSHPNNIDIDNKLELRSLCKNSCIKMKFYSLTLVYIYTRLVN